MKIATKTPGHQVKKNKIPLCLRDFVAEFSLVSGRRRAVMTDCHQILSKKSKSSD